MTSQMITTLTVVVVILFVVLFICAVVIGVYVVRVNHHIRLLRLGIRKYALRAKASAGGTIYWEMFQDALKCIDNGTASLYDMALLVATIHMLEDLPGGSNLVRSNIVKCIDAEFEQFSALCSGGKMHSIQYAKDQFLDDMSKFSLIVNGNGSTREDVQPFNDVWQDASCGMTIEKAQELMELADGICNRWNLTLNRRVMAGLLLDLWRILQD